MGHSMGGMIAVKTAIDAPTLWNGVILSGPLIVPDPNVATPLKRTLAKMVSRWLPKLTLDALDAEEISKDPAVVSAYLNDPLVYRGGFRARWAAEVMMTLDEFELAFKRWTIPFIIQHGSMDKMCMPSGSKKFHAETATDAKDKSIIVYDGLRHEIYNEDFKRDASTLVNQPIRDAVSWAVSML